MDIQTFIQNFREAFGEKAELPLVFWYSDTQEGTAEKINGCFFKGMKTAREGGIISLNAETIGCGGGKFYTGFTEMPEQVYEFRFADDIPPLSIILVFILVFISLI